MMEENSGQGQTGRSGRLTRVGAWLGGVFASLGLMLAAAAPPASAQIGFFLSDCLEATDPDDRLHYCRMHATMHGYGTDEDKATSAIEAARILTDRGEFEEARSILESDRIFSIPRVIEARGDVAFVQGDLEWADFEYSMALEFGLEPSPESRLRMAEAAHAYGLSLINEERPSLSLEDRLELALDPFERALTLNPDHLNARAERARTLSALGRHEEALADLDHVLETRADAEPQELADTQRAGFHARRAAVRRELGNVEGAIADYRTAVELDPANQDHRAALEALLAQP